jgi:AcrR family transcriptional regulator
VAVQRIYPRDAAGAKRIRQAEEEPRVGPGRHGLSREQVADSQRRRVLGATIEIIGRNGVAETPVADLLAHAGIARKTFYELFSGKEECVLSVYDEATTDLRALVEGAYERGVTPQERIDVVVDALFEWIGREPNLARLCLLEVPSSGAAGRKRTASTTIWLTGVLTDWLGDVDVPELLPELLSALATDLTEVWVDVERWPSAPASAA